MNTPTTERLREIRHFWYGRAIGFKEVNLTSAAESSEELLALIDAELARRDAKPVAFVDAEYLQGLILGRYGSTMVYDEYISEVADTALYSAPPATPDTLRDRCEAFDAGWIIATKWAKRADLISDMDSPAYKRERTAALGDSDGK